MANFVFPGFKPILVMGIAELVLGILLIFGVLRSRKSGTLGRIIGGVALAVMGIFFIGFRSTGEIAVEDGSMHLKVPFQRDKVIRTEDITGVREINISIDGDLRPVKRVSGGALGKVKTGWFRLANGEKAFLAVEGVRALYIETSLGFPVIAGAEEFEEFEAAFAGHVYKRVP